MINIRNTGDQQLEVLAKMLWCGTIMGMILALPGLAIFLGIYFIGGNLLLGALVGFSVHFVTLAFSNRISKFIEAMIK